MFKLNFYEGILVYMNIHVFFQGIEGKYILARALTERYAPKEFMIDESLGMLIHVFGI